TLADPQAPFAWIIPVGQGDPAGVAAAFGSLHPALLVNMATGAKDRYALAGSSRALKHLNALTPEARPDLARALAAAGDGAGQLVVAPSADQRRVLAEIYPKFPAWFGGGSTKAVSDGLRWVAASASFAPKLGLKIVTQANSAEAANVLAGLNARAVLGLG